MQTVSFREVTQGSLPKVHVSTTGNHWEICEASGWTIRLGETGSIFTMQIPFFLREKCFALIYACNIRCIVGFLQEDFAWNNCTYILYQLITEMRFNWCLSWKYVCTQNMHIESVPLKPTFPNLRVYQNKTRSKILIVDIFPTKSLSLESGRAFFTIETSRKSNLRCLVTSMSRNVKCQTTQHKTSGIFFYMFVFLWHHVHQLKKMWKVDCWGSFCMH